MKGKSPDQGTLNLFEPVLRQIVKHDHPLTLFADNFPWNDIESEYSSLYSAKGAPAKPVRLMAGLLILKDIFNCSDEGVVAGWARDPYFQYLCGANLFIEKTPCDPSDLARFRKRIGKDRLERLLQLSAGIAEKTAIDSIEVKNGSRPGKEDFSYSVKTGIFHQVIRKINHLAGKVNLPFGRERK